VTTNEATMIDETTDYSPAYTALRGRVIELIERAEPEQLDSRAPATPEWRVRDVLSHLVGVPADVLAGRMDGITTDAWTQAQVDARVDLTVAEILDEWRTTGPLIDTMIPSFGVLGGQFLVDATTHEQDIRQALGDRGEREGDAVDLAFRWLGSRTGDIRAAAGAGSCRIETEAGSVTFGDGDPTATASTSRFEFFRASTGRRSLSQIESWGWTGDARPELVVMPIFVPRAAPFEE
jgi:uncharacterized protein (TIGR03083 family)